jgi:membrane-associated phospholipid phosphatase
MTAAGQPGAARLVAALPYPWHRRPLLAAAILAFIATTGGLAHVHLAPLTAEYVILCGLAAAALLGRTLAVPVIVLTGIPLVASGLQPASSQGGALAITVFCLALRGEREGSLAWPWTLWLAAVVALDDLRGIQAVGFAPHAADVIRFESWLFGGIPTVQLQSHFAGSGLTWYDVAISLVYLMHSPAPLICGAVLWSRRRDLFTPFVVTLLLTGAAGLVTYLLFPETPPWLAAQEHLMEPVRRITNEVIDKVGPLSSVYAGADPLPNAAMPSLHVAYPFIVAWYTVAAFGRRALWIVAYPAVLAIGVVYLGEHWVIDVIAGIAYALAAILAVRYLASRSPLIAGWWSSLLSRCGARSRCPCASGSEPPPAPSPRRQRHGRG